MSLNISIVVATNNPKFIKIFLENLFKNKILPSEIIVVIPLILKNDFIFLQDYKDKIKTIFSKYENQVYQRIDGFKNACNDYVLQMDDDIQYDHIAISKLLENLKQYNNACIAPYLTENNKESTWMNSPLIFKSKMYYIMSYINHGKELFNPGKFSKSGINMTFDNNINFNYEVDWLPGGCILHKKNNLILENYYPYSKGKSFSEDLFHSITLSKKQIKLIYDPTIKLFISPRSKVKINSSSLIEIMKSIKIMNKFVYLSGGNLLRLNLTLIIYYFWLLIYKNKLKSK